MKINKLSLTNYRGIHSLQLETDKRLNVLVGANGAGKSSALDAIAILLSWVVNRLRSTAASGRPILESDILNGSSFSTVELDAATDQHKLSWKLVKSRKGHAAPEEKSNLVGLNEYVKHIQDNISAQQEKCNLPLFVYYPVNRTVLDIPLRIRGKHAFQLFAAYDEGLTTGANFRTFFEWFREREDLENEGKKYADQQSEVLFYYSNNRDNTIAFPDPQLEAVRSALKIFLPEFSNLSVRRNPLRMEVEKNCRPLIVNQLSDGEKCLIAMIGDLARRLAIANPVGSQPLHGQGIVLIDEIDLHLHPQWQRMVVPRLLEVFPNCQFFISTHSPQVITHVKADHLFLFYDTASGIKVEKARESYGKNTDRILEDIMNTPARPDQVKSDLSAVFQKIQQGELEQAKKLVTALKDTIGDDPDLIKAEVLIKRKELIGK